MVWPMLEIDMSVLDWNGSRRYYRSTKLINSSIRAKVLMVCLSKSIMEDYNYS